MVLERILLQTIKFDLQVEHPYMFLLRYVKQLKGWMKFCHYMCTVLIDYHTVLEKLMDPCNVGEKNKVCKVLQMAWTFVNDR